MKSIYVPSNASKQLFAYGHTKCETVSIGDSIETGGGNWFSRLCIISEQRATYTGQFGVGGQTTTAIAARIATDVLPVVPDICIVGGGTNDHAQGVSPETTQENIRGMVDQLRRNKIYPVIRNVPPCDVAGTGVFNTVELRRAAIIAHNMWLEDFGRAEGVPILDMYTPTVDPTGTGGIIDEYDSGDGVHFSAVGEQAVAEYMAARLPDVFCGGVMLPTANAQAGGWIGPANHLMLTDSNADGIADGYGSSNAGSTGTFSIEAASSPVVGNWQKIVQSSGSNAASIYITPSTLEVGASYEVTCRISVITNGVMIRQEGKGDIGDFNAPVEGVFRRKFVATVADGSSNRAYFFVRNKVGGEGMVSQFGMRRIN